MINESIIHGTFIHSDLIHGTHAACTAERFFRVDRAQEHLHYVVDICNEDLYILDADEESSSASSAVSAGATVRRPCPALGEEDEDVVTSPSKLLLQD